MNKNQRIEKIKNHLKQIELEKNNLLQELDQLEKSINNKKPEYIGIRSFPNVPESPSERIELFLKLFCCRQDVFPKLWENKKKNSKGYSPACHNEWNNQYCNKKNVKCSDCKNQFFIEFDDKIAYQHLTGKLTIGTYSIDKYDNCIFLAADFDQSSWKKDVIAYKQSAEELQIQVAIERSRSGNGAHAWIFFSESVKAKQARQLGEIILTKALKNNNSLSLDSYDRFFPNQDYLPSGGFGNLIALPLQKKPREKGNSVFLDENIIPYVNQWDYLSNLFLLSSNDLSTILNQFINDIKDDFIPFFSDSEINISEKIFKSDLSAPIDINKTITLVLKEQIYLNITELPGMSVKALQKLATFANPKYFEMQKLRFSTWNIPKYIFCGDYYNNILTLPRGLLNDIVQLLERNNAEVTVDDKRVTVPKIKVKFQGELYKEQKKAVKKLLQYDNGVLVAPTGTGKTVIACAMITKRLKPSLILVHRSELIEQWIEKLTSFIQDLTQKDIGVLGGARKKLKGKIDIAMLQTLTRKKDIKKLLSQYEHIIIDECHHIPAVSFENVLKEIPARYFLGLTATPQRKDGFQNIIFMQCGKIRHTIDDFYKASQKRHVIFKETNFFFSDKNSKTIDMHILWDMMIKYSERNREIVNDIKRSINENRNIIVLTNRKEHISTLNEMLLQESIFNNIFTISGDTSKKERRETKLEINNIVKNKNNFCLIATGSLLGEGFDIPELDTLILAMPVSFKGRIIQYAGRLHRNIDEEIKDIRIYDYVDTCNGLTISMFKKRIPAYKKMGYIFETESVKIEKYI